MSTPEEDEDAALEARLAALEQEVDAEREAEELEVARVEEELGLGPRARAKRATRAREGGGEEAGPDPDEGPPCIAEPLAEDGSRRVDVPCVHCRELNPFRLRKAKPLYKVRCRECRTGYELELAEVTRSRSSRKRTALLGLGIVGLVGSALGTFARYKLRVRVLDATLERDLDFVAMNPFHAVDFFAPGDLVGLVAREEELMAVCNYRRQTWLTTRAGGFEGVFGSEGRDHEEEDAEGEG